MTIELRSLRISAEMDATNFVAGTKQIETASKGVSAATKEAASGIAAVGAAASATETKVSQSGNVMERLSRQFVDGYGSAQRASAAVNALSREIDKSGYDAARVVPILEGIHRKYGQLGDAAQYAARGQSQLATAITNTTSRMQAQNNVTRIGSAANQNFNTANIAAQFQDIAVTSAMGMSPLQIALQQGTQLSAVLGGQGAAGAARALGAALLSVVNPVSLITIGLVAASAAAIQYFSNWSSSAEKSKEELEKQEQLIGRVASKWGEAAPAIKAYNDELERTKSIGDLIAAQQALVQQQYAGPQAALPSLSVDVGDIQVTLQQLGVGFSKISEFRTEYAELEEKIKNGTATGQDAIDVQRALNSGFQSGSSVIRDYANQFGNLASEIDAANASAQKFRVTQEGGILRGPNGEVSTLSPLNPLDGFNRTPFQTEEEMWLDRQRREEQQRENERLGRLVPIPTPRPNDIERLDMEGGKKGETTSESFIRSQRERIETLQAELGLVGQIDSVREETLASLRAEQQIRQQGLDIYGDEARAIRENAALELRLTQQLIEMRKRAAIRDDLAFEREQLFRTPGEQTIASRLRNTGIPLDGPEAQQMRDNQRFAEAKDLFTGFSSSLKENLIESGGDIGKALGNSMLEAALESADKAWSRIFDMAGNAFASWLTGVTPGAGAAGGVGAFAETGGGLLGMLGANDNYAKGAIARSPLPNVGATRTGIPLSQVSAGSLTAKVSSDYADRFQGLLDDLQNAGYPIKSLGEGGYSFRKVAGSSNLSKHAFGEAIDINPRENPWSHTKQETFSRYGVDADALARENGLTWGGNWRKPDTMHFQVDKSVTTLANSSDKLSKSLDSVTTSAVDTAKGLGGVAQSALSFFPGAPGAAAGGNPFSALFSNANLFTGAFANFNPLSAMTGLFATGGYTGPGGRNEPAGIVHRGEVVWSQDDVMRAGGPHVVDGMRRGLPGYEKGGLVRDDVAPVIRRNEPAFNSPGRVQRAGIGNDNRTVFSPTFNIDARGSTMTKAEFEGIARQQSQAALAEYQKGQARGGFGETQRAYNNRKAG